MENSLGNNEIRLAVLILAHKNLEQLRRLISSMLHENVDVFLHLDKKWNLSTSECNELQYLNKEKVFITNNRISASIYLWSLVEATMELIYKVKQVEREKKLRYHYFALLSGQDYPIKPVDYLLNLLQKSYPKPFIDCTPYDPNNWLKGKFKTLPFENRVLLYFINHWKPGKIRRLKNMLLKMPLYIYFKFAKLFIETPYAKLLRENCSLYGGSAWWILPDKAINVIHKRFSESNDKVIEYISKTLSPEETFFQIMVMQTEVAPLVELNLPHDVRQNCLTYAHFRSEGKPFTGHPYILESSDFNDIKKLPHFFARKFDIKYNNNILDKIEEELLKVPR